MLFPGMAPGAADWIGPAADQSQTWHGRGIVAKAQVKKVAVKMPDKLTGSSVVG
jgi:hypothetical protein